MDTGQGTPRVMRGASADGAWEMVRHAPAPALRGHVRECYGFAERGSRFPERREAASAAVVLIVSFGAPYRVGDAADGGRLMEQPVGFVGGLSESFAVSQATGDAACVQVMLSPLGAHRLLGGLPMHELANRVVGLDALFGADAARLAERLHGAGDWAARFALLDGFLADRVSRAHAPPATVAHAWRRLDQANGRVEIGALAREMGCSRKYLATRFREHVGLPPQSVARVLRFERAVRLLSAGAPARWTDVALGCGWYDQAHFIRDFRRFAGATPGEWARARAASGLPAPEA